MKRQGMALSKFLFRKRTHDNSVQFGIEIEESCLTSLNQQNHPHNGWKSSKHIREFSKDSAKLNRVREERRNELGKRSACSFMEEYRTTT